MTRLLKYLMMCVFAITFPYPTEAATVISENIVFLEEDGRHSLSYVTRRTSYPNYQLFFRKEEGRKLDEYLDKYLYIYPNEYTWDTTSHHQYNLLKFPQGSYAMLGRDDLSKNLMVGEDGVYTYESWDGKTKGPDGHHGIWNMPDNFFQFVYEWVFPQHFEIVEYECNREGEWVQRHNTLTYYGENVNDLVFTIKYRPRSQVSYEALKTMLEGQKQVQLEQQEQGVKVTLEATILFPSGSSELTEMGKSVLTKIVEALKERDAVNIFVAGYTDNVPITGELARIYQTNWELSGARSFAVLHYLIEKGIPESRLEVRAYGSQRPVASNETEEERAKNRRIELLIVESPEP